MANKTVSNLKEVTTVSNSDVLLVETSTETLKVTKGNLLKEVNEELNAKSDVNHTHDEYVTESELNSKGLATEMFVTNKIAEAQLGNDGGNMDLSGYATTEYVDQEVGKTNAQLSQKANKDELNAVKSQIGNIVSNAGDLSENTELLDIRVDVDSNIHLTSGDMVRSIEELYENGYKQVLLQWTTGYVTDTTTNDSEKLFIKTKDFVKGSENAILKMPTGVLHRCVGYNDNKEAVYYASGFTNNDLILSDYAYYKINLRKSDGTECSVSDGVPLIVFKKSHSEKELDNYISKTDARLEIIERSVSSVGKGADFTTESLNFDDFTALSSNNSRYYSAGIIENECYLRKLQIKTDSSRIKVAVANYSNSTLVIKKDFGSLEVLNGYVTIEEDFVLAKNDQIMIQTNSLYFKQGQAIPNKLILSGDLTLGNDSGVNSTIYVPVNITFAKVENIINECLAEDVSDNKKNIKDIDLNVKALSTDVENLKNASPKESSNLYKIVYKSDFKEPHNLTLSNWSVDNVGNYLYPNSKGGYVDNVLTNYVKLNYKYEADKRKARFMCTLYSDTILNFHTIRGLTTGRIPNESMYTLDVKNKKLIMYKNVNRFITKQISQQADIDISIIDGGKYIIELEKNVDTCYFRIINYNTLAKNEVCVSGWDAGTQIQQYALTWNDGVNAPKIHSIDVSILSNPIAMIVGDSITEGYGMEGTTGNNSLKNRFAEYIRNKLGNSIISGASSNTVHDIIDKFDSEIIPLKPKYLICTIGTNGSPTLENYQTILTKCKEHDIELILNYIPAHTDGRHIATNSIIESLNLRGCRFDIATSKNRDLSQGCDTTLLPDGCHPNYYGTLAMIERIDADLDII